MRSTYDDPVSCPTNGLNPTWESGMERQRMDTSIDHLPQQHRDDLARLVDMIRGEVSDAELIILFGSFARGDWKTEDDLPPPEERRSGHPSDYDILVITRGAATGGNAVLWEELSHRTHDMGLQTHARIIGYDVRTFNERIEEGRYFHVDIVKEGKMLYGSGYVTLAQPKKLPPEKRKKLAQEYFDEGMSGAREFFDFFEHGMKKQHHKRAAFQLHQAAEAAYKTILLVFTHYSPHEHLLKTLGREAAMHAPSVSGIFPMSTDEDRDRFMLLDYAYIGARYDRNYSISRDDLVTLGECVRELLQRAEAACRTEIERM